MKNDSTEYFPLRSIQKNNPFKAGDTLVVFGEVFERGYVNGLIDEAKAHGLNIIYATVGRRDAELNLRALTPEELDAKGHGPIINIPLEAGFDLDRDDTGVRPVDQLKDYGLTGWQEAKLDWKSIEQSRSHGIERFRKNVKLFLNEVEKRIDTSKNLIFVHTMAGGFPRARVVMPIANRIFKGSGARYASSEEFWSSEIGQLCEKSFSEVTAQTLAHLIELSKPLRIKVESTGANVCYCAYGYHGNEVMIGDTYQWYSYSPYLQGFAKTELENIARNASAADVKCTVFNVPEILTNSSSIFLGVEVVLYPLLRALRHENPSSALVKNLTDSCKAKLKDGVEVSEIDQITQNYLNNPKVRAWPSLKGWPQHNHPDQMELMRTCSATLIELHKSQNDLMTADLSEVVFRACGKVMYHEIASPRTSVAWICHDLVAKVATQS